MKSIHYLPFTKKSTGCLSYTALSKMRLQNVYAMSGRALEQLMRKVQRHKISRNTRWSWNEAHIGEQGLGLEIGQEAVK